MRAVPGSRALLLVLLLAAAVLHGWRLGEGSLALWDESLTAERSREFRVTGDWLTPHVGLEPDFQKPPLYYWLTALNFFLFGETELSVRLWSVLFGLACLVLAYRTARDATGSRSAGLWAALLLVTTPLWTNRVRQGLLDSGLILGMLGAIHALTWGRPGPGRACAAGLFLSLGAMVKNPLVAGVLIVPWLYHHTRGTADSAFRRDLFGALGVFVCVGLPWYGLQILRWGTAYTHKFLYVNLYYRATQTLDPLSGGPTFYLRHGWARAPVVMMLFGALLGWAFATERPTLRRVAPWALAVLWLLVFFTLMPTKRDVYLLPVLAFAAIAAGGLLDAALQRVRSAMRRRLASGALAAGVCLFLLSRLETLDGCPSLKQVGLYLRSHAVGEDVIIGTRHMAGAVMFYGGRPVRHALVQPLDEAVRDLRLPEQASLFVVARIGEARRLDWAQVARAAGRRPPGTVFKTSEHVVKCFPPAPQPAD
jgi:4-amino-4-deoxy-L-arabinose transferase-like glycosyltransferase